MILLQPDDVQRATFEVQWLLEEELARDGWKALLNYRVLQTSDFRQFQLVPWDCRRQALAPGVFEIWLANVDRGKPLRWARDLFRRGLAPPLSTIEPTELLDTLMLADVDSDYDPAEETARACVADLIAKATKVGALRIVIPRAPARAREPDSDKSQTIVATVVITAFVLFMLSMCSHHYAPAEQDQMDQQQDSAYR